MSTIMSAGDLYNYTFDKQQEEKLVDFMIRNVSSKRVFRKVEKDAPLLEDLA